jgi:SAM-dependent methyltransferase
MSKPEAKKRQPPNDNVPLVRLEETHTRNCRVLPTRTHLLEHLPADGVVAEVGVASGDFTKEILARCQPAKLHLIDTWESDRFQPGLEHVRQRFSDELARGQIVVSQGLSTECLAEFPATYFDWVYIDTDHSYPTTRAELRLAADKVKPGGFIAGHDFTRGNPVRGVTYGVIQACNEFCVNERWEYAFVTLEPSGHFSFALRRLGDLRQPRT